MARLRRVVIPGIPHHVTQRGVRSLPIFRHDRDRKTYLSLLRRHSSEAGLNILAWCLMTNHVHLVALPSREDSLARGIGEAHRKYTRAVNFEEGGGDTFSRNASIPVPGIRMDLHSMELGAD